MKLRTFAAALAATTIAGSAFAADLPSRKMAPEYIAPVPVFTWTGFYVGVNAGYAWADTKYTGAGLGAWGGNPVADQAFLAALQSGGGSKGAFTGGGQLGFNYQFGWAVAGLEADISYLSAKRSSGMAGIFPVAGTVAVSSTQTGVGDYLATVRGRLGFTFGQFLIYGTGGLAIADVSLNQAVFFAATGTTAVGSVKSTRTGWTAGGGVEWAFNNNWSAKIEYLHADLGTVSTTLVNAGFPAFPHAASARSKIDLVRAGLNYRFGWGAPAAVVAKY